MECALCTLIAYRSVTQELKAQHSSEFSHLETTLEEAHRKDRRGWEEKHIENLQSARTQPLITQALEQEYSRLTAELESLREELIDKSCQIQSLQAEKDSLLKQYKGRFSPSNGDQMATSIGGPVISFCACPWLMCQLPLNSG